MVIRPRTVLSAIRSRIVILAVVLMLMLRCKRISMYTAALSLGLLELFYYNCSMKDDVHPALLKSSWGSILVRAARPQSLVAGLVGSHTDSNVCS